MILFGKLPAHGDFVARRLGAEARAQIDDWLSGSLADARDALGDVFEDRFDHAPPWLYLGRGAGALAPSQDAAGRRFPVLLIADEGDEATAQACEALLYQAIGGLWAVDQLADAAVALPSGALTSETHAPPSPPRWWTDGSENFAPATLAGDQPPTLLRAMLEVTR